MGAPPSCIASQSPRVSTLRDGCIQYTVLPLCKDWAAATAHIPIICPTPLRELPFALQPARHRRRTPVRTPVRRPPPSWPRERRGWSCDRRALLTLTSPLPSPSLAQAVPQARSSGRHRRRKPAAPVTSAACMHGKPPCRVPSAACDFLACAPLARPQAPPRLAAAVRLRLPWRHLAQRRTAPRCLCGLEAGSAPPLQRGRSSVPRCIAPERGRGAVRAPQETLRSVGGQR